LQNKQICQCLQVYRLRWVSRIIAETAVFFSSDPNPRCAAIVGKFHQALSALATSLGRQWPNG